MSDLNTGSPGRTFRAQVLAARDSTDQLGALFASLVAEVGRDEASHRWWKIFGSIDASET